MCLSWPAVWPHTLARVSINDGCDSLGDVLRLTWCGGNYSHHPHCPHYRRCPHSPTAAICVVIVDHRGEALTAETVLSKQESKGIAHIARMRSSLSRGPWMNLEATKRSSSMRMYRGILLAHSVYSPNSIGTSAAACEGFPRLAF